MGRSPWSGELIMSIFPFHSHLDVFDAYGLLYRVNPFHKSSGQQPEYSACISIILTQKHYVTGKAKWLRLFLECRMTIFYV